MKQIVAASIPTTKQVRKGCSLAICSVSIITLPTFPYSRLLVVTSLQSFSKQANKNFIIHVCIVDLFGLQGIQN